MNTTNRYSLTFETLAELMPEIRAANANVAQALPNLSSVLKNYSPIPHEAIFLGIANDGLPVLLNLRDPIPGPILVVGNKGSGKTKLLQIIARSIEECHDPDSIRYAVITQNEKDWEGSGSSMNNEGILSFQQPLTKNYLDSLVSWAHSNNQGDKFTILLIDGLEAVSQNREIHQMIRWLLLRGPTRHIWPVVTLNSANILFVNEWLDCFRTRICGHLTDEKEIQVLTGANNPIFGDLLAGSQFSMRENKLWVPFWLPNLD
jgi:hypothetical protein